MTSANSRAVVADAHAPFRFGLASALKRDLGFVDVLETGSVDEAVEHLCRPGVTFASFDLFLPGMAGLAILHGVRHALPSLRVAVVTASERRADTLLALDAGAHGYVPKALLFDGIVPALRSVIGGQVFVPGSLADLAHVDPASLEPNHTLIRDPAELTFHQLQVLHLMAGGLCPEAIARELSLDECNIAVHQCVLFRCLGVNDSLSAIRVVAELGLDRFH